MTCNTRSCRPNETAGMKIAPNVVLLIEQADWNDSNYKILWCNAFKAIETMVRSAVVRVFHTNIIRTHRVNGIGAVKKDHIDIVLEPQGRFG